MMRGPLHEGNKPSFTIVTDITMAMPSRLMGYPICEYRLTDIKELFAIQFSIVKIEKKLNFQKKNIGD